jgi:hypothetical protein
MLLMNVFPTATGAQVKDCLISTATDPVQFVYNPNAFLGGGILNVQGAYSCVQKAVEPPLDCTARRVPPCVNAVSGEAAVHCWLNAVRHICLCPCSAAHGVRLSTQFMKQLQLHACMHPGQALQDRYCC